MNSFSRAVVLSYGQMVESVLTDDHATGEQAAKVLEDCLRQAVLSEDCNYDVSSHFLNLALSQVDYRAIVQEWPQG